MAAIGLPDLLPARRALLDDGPLMILAGTGPATGRASAGHPLTEASMEPNSSTPERAFLEDLRRRRAELLESMSAVEQALAAPAPGRQARWAERVAVALSSSPPTSMSTFTSRRVPMGSTASSSARRRDCPVGSLASPANTR
jgi:hypothetical protein